MLNVSQSTSISMTKLCFDIGKFTSVAMTKLCYKYVSSNDKFALWHRLIDVSPKDKFRSRVNASLRRVVWASAITVRTIACPENITLIKELMTTLEIVISSSTIIFQFKKSHSYTMYVLCNIWTSLFKKATAISYMFCVILDQLYLRKTRLYCICFVWYEIIFI